MYTVAIELLHSITQNCNTSLYCSNYSHISACQIFWLTGLTMFVLCAELSAYQKTYPSYTIVIIEYLKIDDALV